MDTVITNLQQQRQITEQLRREAALKRIMVSKAVEDIIKYITEHEQEDCLLMPSTLSVSLVSLDSYQSVPVSELDATFSDFRGTEIRHVPVVRIFGSTTTGIKVCLHVHGAFPYMYVPCVVEENLDSFMYKLAAAMDSAINVSLGSATSNAQHIYKIQRVSGIPFYGYHEKEHFFLKIYFYNPAMIKRAADLLQGGAIMNRSLQPFEAHIPFILQFMMDYNLYGMSLIHLKDVKYRRCAEGNKNSQNESASNSSDSQKYLPASVVRQSTCRLEADAQACEILNKQETLDGLNLNPGIAAIWNDEKFRREANGLRSSESQLLFTNSSNRVYGLTENDIYQEERLARRLQAISQTSDRTSVNSDTPSCPLEAEGSRLRDLNEESERETFLSNKLLELEKSYVSKKNLLEEKNVETSILDTEDLNLVEILDNLAEANEEENAVDNDSVLGSQYSVYDKQIKEDNEDDEVEDLNITSLDLDTLSSWNSIGNAPSQSSGSHIENKEVEDVEQTTDTLRNDEDSLLNFPQCDGASDLCPSRETALEFCEKREAKKRLERTFTIDLLHDGNKVLDRKGTIFELNLHEILNPKENLYQILCEYFLKYITIDAKLLNISGCDCVTDKNFDRKEPREFKSKRRRVMNVIKGSDSHSRKKIFNVFELDHQDLDVYDVDEIEFALSAKDCASLKQAIRFNESLPTSLPTKLKIPALDGNALDSSSDSEMDQDVTVDSETKRICEYKSRKKAGSDENVVDASFQKRKMQFESTGLESPRKRRNIGANSAQNESQFTPRKTRTVQSPKLGKYSPLNVMIISPRADRIEPCTSGSNYVASATPKRDNRRLRTSLLRERLCGSPSEAKQGRPIRDRSESIVASEEATFDDAVDVNKESISQNGECDAAGSQQKSKEVRKRLNFVNDNKNETGFVKRAELDDFSLMEETSATSRQNNYANVPVTNSIKRSFLGTDTEEEERNSNNIFDDKTPEMFEENFETPSEDECNMTFTQYLSKKLDSQNCASSGSANSIAKDKLITIAAKFNPPSRERILSSMDTYDISRCKSNAPFFSKRIDLVKYKETSNKNNIGDLVPFKSSLDGITGIKLWRRLKINEFYPSGANIKSCDMRRALAGYNSVTIQPLVRPPTANSVETWVRAKRYLLKKSYKRLQNDRVVEKIEKEGEASSSNLDCEKKVTGNEENDESTADSNKYTKKESQTSNGSQHSRESNDSLNPSLRKMLENSLLYKNVGTPQHLGISYGQIEYSMKEQNVNVADENLQNARGLTVQQYLTVLSLEVHVVTRGKLLPDPEHDSIQAIFYSIYNDVPLSSHAGQIEHGAIVVNSVHNSKAKDIYSTSTSCPVSHVSNEEDLLNSLLILIRHCDPDILVGWEIESLSWGYVLQRASRVGLNNFACKISRISQVASKGQPMEKDSLTDLKIPGRIVLDVWRIMRHEMALLSYTFENVMYNVMRERISRPTFQTLSDWWKHGNVTMQWRVIAHYVTRVTGTLRMLIQLDIIGRTCEHARLFGIQFYEVFSRGSQFRVESMMLRLAKPMNYIPISPSVQQRAKMRAPEFIPLIMEPQSVLYTDPLIVLDFQSLYPSIIIAYNYCFSTCLGRVERIGHREPFEFGAATLTVTKSTIEKLKGKINFAPCGVAFVRPEVRSGILPRMLTEILNTRLMVKESMKLHRGDDSVLQRVLHSQQLGLKLIANVTYGYTSANFSGRMPCIEIADSVVSKGRETLERAIKIVESTPKWGARVVYGDTDSLFILLPGRSREDAFAIGNEIADTITAANPPPVKLKFEKVLQPSILQTKKRYCGYMYESPEQKEPEYLAKGIETVRRDGCPAVAKILEKSLKILFDTNDLSLIKSYVVRQFDKILRRKISIQDLTFAKEFRGLSGYKANACVPALELTRRLTRKDPRAVPRTGERVRYVVVAGAPNQPLIHCVRTPMEVITDEGLTPNSVYYITKVIIPPLNRCLNLIGLDAGAWYREMSHRQTPDKAVSLFTDNQKLTIRQFFSTVVCAACGDQTQKDICSNCMANPSQTITISHEKLRWLERTYRQLTTICQSCTGYLDHDVECESLDCPVFYRLAQARRDLVQMPYLNNIIHNRDNFSTDTENVRR